MYATELKTLERGEDHTVVHGVAEVALVEDLSEALDIRAHWLLRKLTEGGIAIDSTEGSEIILMASENRIYTASVTPL